MAARKTSGRKPRREKTEMLKNIKDSMSVEKTRLDPEEQAISNIEVASNIAKVAVVLENLSNDQTDVLKDILKALENIPENVGESIEQSEKILEKLVKAIVKLEKDLEAAEKKGDKEKAEALRGSISTLRGEADKAIQGGALAAGPQTMGEVFANMLGVSPRELRGAGGGVGGFFKAFAGGMKNNTLDAFTPRLNKPPTLEETLERERNRGKISDTLGEARKADVAERMKLVPEHLRVKVDPETGMRYRTGTKGNRINEFEESGAKNSRFEFGTLGGLVDEETGEAYDYKTKGSMRPTREGFGDADGVDEATDTGTQEILDKMDDINDTLQEVVSAIEGVETGGGGGLDIPIPRRLFPRGGKPPKGAGSVADDVAKAGASSVDDAARAAGSVSRGSRLLGGAGRLLGRLATPLTIAAGAYEGYTGYQQAKALEESGAITTEEANKQKGSAVGGAVVGTGGALAGAAAGAAIGSVVPVVGTAIGGLVGGLVGYFGGKAAGEVAGSAIGGAVTSAGTASMQPGANPAAAVATTQTRSRTAAASALSNGAAASPATQPIINNIDNSSRVNAPPATQQQPSSVVVTVRDTSSSHIRFNNRRMARVM